MPQSLPPNATPDSLRLYHLARRVAASCPPDYASEIALVGSAAMGLSDHQSDLDINFWNETIPPERARVAWLESLGATEVKVGSIRADRSYPIAGMVEGVEVGCSWQTITSLRFFVELITTADENEYRVVQSSIDTFTAVLVQGIPLRTSGILEEVQQQLETYPDSMMQRELKAVISVRGYETAFKGIRRSLRYGDEAELMGWITDAVGSLIKALYPINRRWYPQDKWRFQVARDLPLQPPNLYTRIGLALHDPELHQRPRHLVRLMLDTLALVKDDYDISAGVATLETFMKENE